MENQIISSEAYSLATKYGHWLGSCKKPARSQIVLALEETVVFWRTRIFQKGWRKTNLELLLN